MIPSLSCIDATHPQPLSDKKCRLQLTATNSYLTADNFQTRAPNSVKSSLYGCGAQHPPSYNGTTNSPKQPNLSNISTRHGSSFLTMSRARTASPPTTYSYQQRHPKPLQ
mmetsp:Transcript_31932/g.57750  ORF Transcript_31932/g.57750 Transcript_31932/m.57750 type:complete len:110 (+) Transcript_31932:58-387(+)